MFSRIIDYCCIVIGAFGIIVGIAGGAIPLLLAGGLLAVAGVGGRLGWNAVLLIVLLSASLLINLFFVIL